ncbi:reverse transcriptase [Trichuris suis]|nr:reverse transcriptase [Trichuris suis]
MASHWFGRKPHTGYFRTFGIKGFVLKKRPEKGKFDPRGILCTFVGYSEVSKGFRVVLDGERHVSVSKDLKCVDNFGETETVGKFLTAETVADCTHHDDPQDEDKLQNHIDIPVTMNGQMSVGLPAGPVTVPHEEAQRDPQVRCRGRPRLIRTRKRGRPRKQYHFRETSAECPSDETKEEPVECMEEDETVERNVEASAVAEISVAEAMESPDARECQILSTARVWLQQLRKLKYPVCKLRKAIYGLKQSSRQWYKKLDEKLRYLGMKPLEPDPCVYSVPGTDGASKLVAIYVDETFVLSNDIKWIKGVKTELAKTFKVRDLGPISYGLGIQFKQDEKKGTISMSQRLYVLNLLERFGMQNCKPATTPLAPNLKLTKPLTVSKEEMLSKATPLTARHTVGPLEHKIGDKG